LTAAYDAKQAVLAAAVGAEYIAPYVGRVNDAGKNGLEECMRMMDVVDGLDGETRILCASIRSTDELVTLAEAGLDTFTVSPQVIRMLLQNDLTAKAAADFEEAAKRGAAKN
jgi:transaldolase